MARRPEDLALIQLALGQWSTVEEAKPRFIAFCSMLTLMSKSGEEVQFNLNEIQLKYLDEMTQRDIILKPRQVGMTSFMLAWDIFCFLTVPGAAVVVMCLAMQGNRPLNEICDELARHFKRLKAWGINVDAAAKRKDKWLLEEMGSQLTVMVAGASDLSANKGPRGVKITHLHCTEIAFWDRPDETWNATKRAIPPPSFGSRVVWESTPNGAVGLFYEQFRMAVEGRGGYKGHFFPWYEVQEYRTALLPGEVIVPNNPLEARLDPEQVKWYRELVDGEDGDKVTQEYPSDQDSCFLAQGRSYFDATRTLAMIDAAKTVEAESYLVGLSGKISPTNLQNNSARFARMKSIRVFHKPDHDREYVVALDPSEGVGLDAAAGVVLERGTGRHMATVWGQFKPEELAYIAVSVAKEFNWAEIACERLNHGHAVRVALTADFAGCGLKAPYPNLFRDHDGKFGWINTVQSRTTALDHLEQAIRTHVDKGGFNTSDIWLLREIKDFVVKETSSGKARAEAERGKHDDLVFALCIAWSVISRRRVRRDVSALAPA